MTLYQIIQKIICSDIIIVVKVNNVQASKLILNHSCNQCFCLTNEIHTSVSIGIIIHKVGDASFAIHCFNIDLNHKIIFKTLKNTTSVMKNNDKIIEIEIVILL